MRYLLAMLALVLYTTSNLAAKTTIANSNKTKWVEINQVIHAEKLATGLKKHLITPPASLPTKVPAINKTMYASLSTEKHLIWFVFGEKPHCYGHECMIGSITYELNRKPEMEYNDTGTLITQKLMLKNNIPGFFTPTHNLGATFPATINWRCRDLYFNIEWSLPTYSERNTLVKLANNIIDNNEICNRPQLNPNSLI